MITRKLMALLAIGALMLAACGGGTGDTDDSGADTGAQPTQEETSPGEMAEDDESPSLEGQQTQITFQLDWIPFGRHAPYYVALDKYYPEAGLDVEIIQGNGIGPVYQNLLAGNADISFNDLGYLPKIVADNDTPLHASALIYEKAPHSVFYLESAGVEDPKDLEGLSHGTSAGNAVELLYPVFAEANNIDQDKIDWVTMDPQNFGQALLGGQVDVITTFVLTHPFLQANAPEGENVEFFMFGDHGVPILANGIVTTKEFAEANPDVLCAFTRATLKGVQDAFNDPEGAMEIMLKHKPEANKETGVQEIEIIRDRLAPTGEPFGVIEPEQMKTTVDISAEVFGLENPPDPEDLYSNECLG